MAFDNMDMEMEEEESIGGPPPEESSNRTFLIVAGVLGGIMVLTLLCTAVYAFFFLPRSRSIRATEAAEAIAQNTAMALSVRQTQDAAKWTATPTITLTSPPATATPTRTSVIAVAATSTATPGEDPRTATVAALLTQAAAAQTTVVPTSTLLPQSGFADEIGLPALMGLALVFVVVIFLARRLRAAT